LWKPSAAQNVTVIQTCKQCGAINDAESIACCFCDGRLYLKDTEENSAQRAFHAGTSHDARTGPSLPAVPVSAEAECVTAQPSSAEPVLSHVIAAQSSSAQTRGNLAVATDWHTEVTHRLAAYRARRRHLRSDSAQPAFAFEETPQLAPKASFVHTAYIAEPSRGVPPRRVPSRPVASRSRVSAERLDMALAQPTLDFASAERHARAAQPDFPQVSTPSPIAIASLKERRRAGLLDSAFLLFSYGGFVALFSSLGGHFTPSKFDVAITLLTLGLVYAQYFALFTYFGGATPGMMMRGLRLVSFAGGAPTSRQLLWRSVGYVAAAAPVMLGFFWALWDEDHLTWQDRLSQTYVTTQEPALDHVGHSPHQHMF
jgi:uncharacterized RDD family membrane protein YckC